MFCLHIVKAHPDYKRPYASAQVFHFATKEDANEKRREEKRKYYKSFLEYLESVEELIPQDIDNLDEDVAQTDFIYVDSYMDMQPFTSTLYEIDMEEDFITSKRVEFPKTNIIEGV